MNSIRGFTRSTSALLSILCTVSSVSAQKSLKPLPIQTTIMPISESESEYSLWEPHIAADPEDPNRALVAAIFGEYLHARSLRRPKQLYLRTWRTGDGGESWSEAQPPFRSGSSSTRLNCDPVVVSAGSSGFWLVGCDYQCKEESPALESMWIKAATLKNDEKKWRPALIVSETDNRQINNGGVDKPWIVADNTGGKRSGTVYVAWTRLDAVNQRSELWCLALPPGASRFSPAVQLGQPIALQAGHMLAHEVQLTVRSDGTLDVVWQVPVLRRIVHAYSTDGAKTFSQPTPILDMEPAGTGEFPSLAAVRGGKLVAAWKNRSRILCSIYSSGRWSAPVSVTGDAADGVRFSHAAIAATADAVWLLAYRQEDKADRVQVVLYRSSDEGRTWSQASILATREFTNLMSCSFSPGDYIGLASSKDILYAAYSLPMGLHERTKRLYVSVIHTKKGR
jgi:hypothetical protein